MMALEPARQPGARPFDFRSLWFLLFIVFVLAFSAEGSCSSEQQTKRLNIKHRKRPASHAARLNQAFYASQRNASHPAWAASSCIRHSDAEKQTVGLHSAVARRCLD